MKNLHLTVVLLSLIFLSGCATTVHTFPDSITIPIVKKHDSAITIVISKEDLNRRELVAMGIVGNLFPLKVEVGKVLKMSAEDSFSKLFSKVTFGDTYGLKTYNVTIKIEKFSMLGVDAKAHLELHITMNNDSGGIVLEKTYAGVGSGHAPVYWSEETQKQQVSKSTKEAFQLVFNNIAADVIKLEIK